MGFANVRRYPFLWRKGVLNGYYSARVSLWVSLTPGRLATSPACSVAAAAAAKIQLAVAAHLATMVVAPTVCGGGSDPGLFPCCQGSCTPSQPSCCACPTAHPLARRERAGDKDSQHEDEI